MKKVNYLGFALLFALFGLVACNKSAQPSAVPEYNGVKVDIPKLQRTFENGNSDVQQSVNETIQGVRYGMYDRSVMALDKLANDPNVTEEQKKVVNEIMEAVKQLVSKAPPPPPSQ